MGRTSEERLLLVLVVLVPPPVLLRTRSKQTAGSVGKYCSYWTPLLAASGSRTGVV